MTEMFPQGLLTSFPLAMALSSVNVSCLQHCFQLSTAIAQNILRTGWQLPSFLTTDCVLKSSNIWRATCCPFLYYKNEQDLLEEALGNISWIILPPPRLIHYGCLCVLSDFFNFPLWTTLIIPLRSKDGICIFKIDLKERLRFSGYVYLFFSQGLCCNCNLIMQRGYELGFVCTKAKNKLILIFFLWP